MRVLLVAGWLALVAAFSAGLGGVPSGGASRSDEIAVAMEFRRLAAMPSSQRSMNEDFMLGIAYYEGLPEAGVAPDPAKARELFENAFRKGYEYGAVHVLLSDIRANDAQLFLDDANRYLAANLDPSTKQKILKVVSDRMIETGNTKLAEPYLKILADFFDDPGAAVSLAVIYREGLDGRGANANLANSYLNKGCRNPLANEEIRSFCAQFRK